MATLSCWLFVGVLRIRCFFVGGTGIVVLGWTFFTLTLFACGAMLLNTGRVQISFRIDSGKSIVQRVLASLFLFVAWVEIG